MGARRVNYYRLYRLKGHGGGFVGFEEIEAGDDQAAMAQAAAFTGAQPLELWCGSRKVDSIAPVAPVAERGTASA